MLVYLILFVKFTIPLPDHWHREVGGFTYTPKAEWTRGKDPGISDKELVVDMEQHVEKVFGPVSLAVTRTVFLVVWLIIFFLGSCAVASFLILQRRGLHGSSEAPLIAS